jgi:hypothetical protein
MSDRPWLEDADPALRSERALLERLNAQEPPPGSVDHGWAALAAQIAVPVAPSPPLATGAQSAGLSLAAKVVAGMALTGGLAWSGAQLLAPSAPPAAVGHHVAPPRAQPPRGAPPLSAPVVESPLEAPSPKLPTPAGGARAASSATTLAEEGRLLAKAHQLVQSGQGEQALEVLRVLQSRYPRSVLFQEREVLTIEALGATGASAAAKRRAQQFLKRYPGSPHAGRLERFVD